MAYTSLVPVFPEVKKAPSTVLRSCQVVQLSPMNPSASAGIHFRKGGRRALLYPHRHDGAGHFVKMVHNGIEYADMQVIGEAYHLLRNATGMSPQKSQKSSVSGTQVTLIPTSFKSPPKYWHKPMLKPAGLW